MHLLVLSAFRRVGRVYSRAVGGESQCTFWCSVLSDWVLIGDTDAVVPVSMHLLVLSAFRRREDAQWIESSLVSMHLLVLSAFRREAGYCPKAGKRSQCTFWCSVLSDRQKTRGACWFIDVSMHLLVLSAFRLKGFIMSVDEFVKSQCTFWCSVLSDSAPRKPRHNAVYRNEIAADLESTTSNRLAPV